MSAATVAAAASLAETSTEAPSRAKRRAIAAPIPRLAPVMTTVLSVKRDNGSSLFPYRWFASEQLFSGEIVGDQHVDVTAAKAAADGRDLPLAARDGNDARHRLQFPV